MDSSHRQIMASITPLRRARSPSPASSADNPKRRRLEATGVVVSLRSANPPYTEIAQHWRRLFTSADQGLPSPWHTAWTDSKAGSAAALAVTNLFAFPSVHPTLPTHPLWRWTRSTASTLSKRDWPGTIKLAECRSMSMVLNVLRCMPRSRAYRTNHYKTTKMRLCHASHHRLAMLNP
ncbi:hypothetical protein GGR55DRAFT_262948 [Xylaria sp. FL0064]|nr:hypothetical protein GGR55DRAFT_262948 [Xylaria sp. FL0064]